MTTTSTPPADRGVTTITPCGGCGNSDPERRCLGCMHPFFKGDWPEKYASHQAGDMISEAMVEAAYDAFTRSFGSSPIGTNNTRNDLRAALTAALSAPAPGTGGGGKVAWLTGENERLCDDAAMQQWSRSLKRPDLAEKDRVRGALEAFKRQAVALQMLSAATSTSPAIDMGAVKPLKWQSAAEKHWFAETPFGGYEVVVFDLNGLNTRLKSPFTTVSQWCPDQASAKAAAQKDYESRILSALSSTPVGEMDAATIEACARIADDHTPAKHEGTLAAHVTGRNIASAIRAASQQGVR